MSDLRQRIANLSPEKRALLEQRLMQMEVLGRQPQTVPPRQAADPCPLSFAQQRLWFLDRFDPGNAIYNLPKAVRLQGRLDPMALQQALDAIVARHAALRTTFAMVDGEPVQVIREPEHVRHIYRSANRQYHSSPPGSGRL